MLLFHEKLTYTEGAFSQDTHYYDGTIASATYFTAGDEAEEYTFQYEVDDVGRILHANNEKHQAWSLALDDTGGYDANGNFLEMTRGSTTRQYEYFDGTQQVKTVLAADDSALAEYAYNLDGNAHRAKTVGAGIASAHDLRIDYDPGSKMTTKIADSVTGGKTLRFLYGKGNQRVLKSVWSDENQLLEKKLYIRGVNARPLCELSKGASERQALYFYGPTGLVGFQRNGATYGVSKDHLGSIRGVFDRGGKVVASYDYLTFGELAAIQEPEPNFVPYLFTGQEYDWESGLYNYGPRFYSGQLGRFIETDPDASRIVRQRRLLPRNARGMWKAVLREFA